MAADPMEDMRDRLANDGALAAIATGGVFIDRDSSEFPLHPKKDGDGSLLPPWEWAIDGQEIDGQWMLMPCIVLSESTQAPDAPRQRRKGQFIRMGLYQRQGYDLIRQMIPLAKAVIDPNNGDGTRWGPMDGDRYYFVRYVDTPIQGNRDETLVSAGSKAGVSYEACRFFVRANWS